MLVYYRKPLVFPHQYKVQRHRMTGASARVRYLWVLRYGKGSRCYCTIASEQKYSSFPTRKDRYSSTTVVRTGSMVQSLLRSTADNCDIPFWSVYPMIDTAAAPHLRHAR